MLTDDEIKVIQTKKQTIMDQFFKGIGHIKLEVAIIELSQSVEKLLTHIENMEVINFNI